MARVQRRKMMGKLVDMKKCFEFAAFPYPSKKAAMVLHGGCNKTLCKIRYLTSAPLILFKHSASTCLGQAAFMR